MNSTLKNAVIRKVGKDSLRDVNEHGADGGFPGFIYYTDTCAFFRRHRKAIEELVAEMAGSLGEDVLKMIAGFRCLGGDFSEVEIGRVLFAPWKDDDAHQMIGNALAWFALEEVAREVCDN